MTWIEAIRLRIARVQEEQFLSRKLTQFQRQAGDAAQWIRKVFSRDSSTQEVRGEITHIGRSVFVKGELAGGGDLIVEGRMEGQIAVKDHSLVVGPHANINAQINAKNVIVTGRVIGNICASRMVEIRSPGSVAGDIAASRISIEEGARFKGSVDIQRRDEVGEKAKPPRAATGPVIPSQSSGKID